MTTKKNTKQKKATAAKKAPSKDKIEEIQVADGKKEIEEIKNLEELLGVQQVNPFGTSNKEVLEERLREMGLSDLQAFAVKIGLLPSGNKLNLKNKIRKEFQSHPGAGASYHIGFQKPLLDPKGDRAAEFLKILNSDK